jgi:APA family basic amino acid/polyamine antiporter
MTPRTGGFYAYAHRAFGDYGGFVVGWSDWTINMLALAYISVVFGEYASGLFFPDLAFGRVICSVSVILIFTIINLLGVRSGSGVQKLTSALKAIALVAFAIACFAFGGEKPVDAASVTQPATIFGFVLAMQFVLGTYDGWYSSVYFCEEDTDPSRNIPRSMFSAIALVTVIYLLVNVALLHVLPMSQLAASNFAGADAMGLIFGTRAGQMVTVLALLSLIGIINAQLMTTPRIMFALGRDGLCTSKADAINKGGTPAFATLIAAGCAIVLTASGTFELLWAIAQFFAVVNMILLVIAFFVLRRREPDAPRPFRAWGYPYAPLLMLIIAVLLFVGYCVSNVFPSAIALAALLISYPLFRLVKR